MGSQGRTEAETRSKDRRKELGPAGEEEESLARLWEKVSGSSLAAITRELNAMRQLPLPVMFPRAQQ